MVGTWTREIYDTIALITEGSLQIHNSDWRLFELVVVEYSRPCYFYKIGYLFCRVEQSLAMILS